LTPEVSQLSTLAIGEVGSFIAALSPILKDYFRYYQEARTHLPLGKDAPVSRAIQPNSRERIVAIPLGGLEHWEHRGVFKKTESIKE